MKRKWLLALGISCPACAGGFILVMGAVFGLSAALVKGSLLLAGITIIGFFWVRNAWRRRGEEARLADACDACPTASTRVSDER